jgi:photosystem II stability/assembly factor-like uncharacterized protein
MRCLALGLLALSACLSFGQLTPPPSQNADLRQFNMTKHGPTSAEVRLKGYQQRLAMEAASPYSQIRWRNVGPEIQGGRVIAFDSPRNAPEKCFVAYATGGLWMTDDMGTEWQPLTDSLPGVAIGDFAVNKDGNTIWVGTGENNSQRTSYDGMGVFKSTNEGKTWTYTGLAETQRIGRILINPKNENTVYVAAIGGLYSTSPDRGVYKTTDGGKTWAHVLKIDDATGVVDMVMDPRNPDVLYAAAWDRERRAWNMKDGGPGTAIYKTIDGGKTWAKVMNGIPANNSLGRIGIAIAPSKPDRLYLYIDNQGGDEDTLYRDEYVRSGILTAHRFRLIKDPAVFTAIDRKILDTFAEQYLPKGTKMDDILQGIKDKKMTLDDVAAKMAERNKSIWEMPVAESEIYRTDDGGKNWAKVSRQFLDTSGYGYYCGRIVVNPRDADEVLFTSMMLYRSHDGGVSFEIVPGNMHSDYHMYWFDPKNPRFQAAGNDGGLYWSLDNGDHWRHLNNMAVGQFTTVGVDNKTPYNIFGGLQDNGTMKGPSNYNRERSNPWQWAAVGGGDGAGLAIDQRNDGDVIYGSSQFGSYYGFDQKANQRWSFGGRASFANANGLRWNWVTPIVISKHKPDVIYIGSNRVHRSTAQGKSAWETISPDLTTNTPNGDVPFSTIKDLSESPFTYGVLYAGTDDGKVWVTKDDGANWTNIDTPANKWVCRLVASKYDAGTVFCAQTGYREDDYTPYLWKSTDFGKTWTSIVGNLPTEMINVVREDTEKKDWLYVGTDLGVFFTKDGGKDWIPLNGGIPRTPVHDIAIQAREKELVIGTHARSAWVFPLSELYSLTDEIMAKDVFVFPLADMARSDWEYRRIFTPKPEEEEEMGFGQDEENAQAPGLQRGGGRGGFSSAPTLRGQLWTKEPGAGSIRLKDKDGKVIKEMPINWTRGLNRYELDLLLQKGNRFSMDPRKRVIKTADDAVKDPYENERPKYVPAGEYTVEFTIGGKTESAKWKLTG